MLFVSPGDFRALSRSGKFLPALNIAGRERWLREDVEAFIAHQRLIRYGANGFDPIKHALDQMPTIPVDIPEQLTEVADKLRGYDDIPPCVYFLINFGVIVYVGQTKHLPVRLHQHRRGAKGDPPKEFNRVVYLPVDPAMLDQAEAYYIKLLEPILNKAGVSKV